MKNILTFDIEDNFTHAELSNPEDWGKYEKQVVENTRRILTLLARYNIQATFFVLAKVAERRPEVVKMIMSKGHEIASHGYIHERVQVLGRNGFQEDVLRSKRVIEALTGQPVQGFRAMAFSINTETAWAIDILKDQGFLYDSSILSTCFKRQFDGFENYFSDSFFEVSPSAFSIAGRDLAFGGGIFFRTAPYNLIRSLIKRENKAGRPVVIYAHAWEFNKDQPKRNVSPLQSLSQSPLTFTTPHRIECLLKEFTFNSIENCLETAK